MWGGWVRQRDKHTLVKTHTDDPSSSLSKHTHGLREGERQKGQHQHWTLRSHVSEQQMYFILIHSSGAAWYGGNVQKVCGTVSQFKSFTSTSRSPTAKIFHLILYLSAVIGEQTSSLEWEQWTRRFLHLTVLFHPFCVRLSMASTKS